MFTSAGVPSKMTSAAACEMAPLDIMADCCCCKRCGVAGCDIKILDCNCCLHARCMILHENVPMTSCPVCQKPARSMRLLPMSFDELDKAQAEAAKTKLSDKRGKKRQNATISRLDPERNTEDHSMSGSGELRTGRWTAEETAYCDKLIDLFDSGSLAIPDSLKLNDFLSLMLKSKQSRLTKKMKNAKFSSKLYQHALGYIESTDEATMFSQLETRFFKSIRCNMERSEIRFHMQKIWRELFSAYCASIGVKIDADAWLISVEEIDRRLSRQKDAARTARRKMMMGYALSHDSANKPSGVFIDPHLDLSADQQSEDLPVMSRESSSETLNRASKRSASSTPGKGLPTLRRLSYYSSPFVGKIIHFIRRNSIPFEYCDVWVPSQVPSESTELLTRQSTHDNNKCRLCFAGSGTTEVQAPLDGSLPIAGLTDEELFDLNSFGLYSQRFSFDVGCGTYASLALSAWVTRKSCLTTLLGDAKVCPGAFTNPVLHRGREGSTRLLPISLNDAEELSNGEFKLSWGFQWLVQVSGELLFFCTLA
ncbi:hypothetical protein MPSEU_000486600 [Mayamaea pseudoterrestris]|nr:hypothetical protein MPSEU_000486600 [Mayamaea pseudoterrestris]